MEHTQMIDRFHAVFAGYCRFEKGLNFVIWIGIQPENLTEIRLTSSR